MCNIESLPDTESLCNIKLDEIVYYLIFKKCNARASSVKKLILQDL